MSWNKLNTAFLLFGVMLSSSASSSRTSAALVATTTAALAVGLTLLWKKKQQHQPKQTMIRTAADLKHNWNATASDVLRIYANNDNHVQQQQQRQKIYVLTGTTSGLGKYCALLLGEHTNCHIIMGVRDVQRGKQIQAQILNNNNNKESTTKSTASVFHLDLTSLQSVRDFTALVVETLLLTGNKKIDGIINNAGCFQTPGFTDDGHQITWQVNALAPALLTELLLPSLSNDGRVINVSSDMHKMIFGSNIAAKCPPTTSSGASQWDYALSKACQILHATHLQNRFRKQGTTRQRAFAVDPGLVQTNVARNVGPWMQWFEYSVLGFFFLRTMDEGCATYLYCLLAPDKDLDYDNGIYFGACGAKKPKRACQDPDQAEALARVFCKAWGD